MTGVEVVGDGGRLPLGRGIRSKGKKQVVKNRVEHPRWSKQSWSGPSVAADGRERDDAGHSGKRDGVGLVGCGGPGVGWGGVNTHLLMYSPVRMTLQVWHLKQLTCHCLSSARSDWPCLISSLHPAQSAKMGDAAEQNLPGPLTYHHLKPISREFPLNVDLLAGAQSWHWQLPRDSTRGRKRPPQPWPVDKGLRGRKERPSCFSSQALIIQTGPCTPLAPPQGAG